MDRGYLALLDVLGFSALVNASDANVQRYLDCLKAATKDTPVDFIVFSDSIVLTMPDDSPNGLITVARSCCRLMHDLVLQDIPVRGAIAHGSFLRETVAAESVFVAGHPVIEAYRFEQEQDWIGIMLAPSAVKAVPDLRHRCRILGDDAWEWARYIQPYGAIPFHRREAVYGSAFDGFALLPTAGNLTPPDLCRKFDQFIEKLEWLRSIAPAPAEQNKYHNTTSFLRAVRSQIEKLANTVGMMPKK